MVQIRDGKVEAKIVSSRKEDQAGVGVKMMMCVSSKL